jgi:hypothetical protein
MTPAKNKPLMRSLGEFVGHIVKAVKTDPRQKRVVLKKTQQQVDRGNVTLRRRSTTRNE